jgi:hypothetical protein
VDRLLSNEDLFAVAGRYGYLHPSYAEAFAAVGEVRHLRRSGSWMLTRAIPGSDRRDALIGYPRLICRDWVGLVEDLRETAALADVVSVTAVTDALAAVDEELLRPAFGDLVRVDALHHVIDLVGFWPAREHRRAVRAAMQRVDIDIVDAPTGLPGQWDRLAGGSQPGESLPGEPLRGGPLPSEPLPGVELGLPLDALERQLALPGCVAFTVLGEDGPVARAVVYVSGEHAYLHALAVGDAGEGLGARYALVQAMVEDMVGRGLRYLDLGAVREDAAFMAGWTELTRPAYRCGRIVDRLAYDELAAATGTTGSAIFPAYRDPAARLGP